MSVMGSFARIDALEVRWRVFVFLFLVFVCCKGCARLLWDDRFATLFLFQKAIY